MKRQPITHLLLVDNFISSDEDHNGGCDFCLVAMTGKYVSLLLARMDSARGLCRHDDKAHSSEYWDSSPVYFQDNDRLQELSDVNGDMALDVPPGEPILLTADPKFSEADLQRVDCQTVQVSRDEVWWTACVKHTGIRIESAHVGKKTLLRILRSLGRGREPRGRTKAEPIHPAIRKIHDLLYLDMKNGRESYDPEKCWDAGTMSMVAEIVAEHIPRPPRIES